MNYVTNAGFTDVLTPQQQAQLTDDNPSGDDITDSGVVTTFLEAAESFADSFVSARYETPLQNPTEAFKQAIYIIAKYQLLLRREYADEATQRQYDNTIQWLMMVRDGDVTLDSNDLISDSAYVGLAEFTELTFEDHLFRY